MGGRDFDTTISYESSLFVIMTALSFQSRAFGLTWSAVVLGVFNKFMFRGNWWHFRWRGCIVPTAVILPTIELYLDIMAITAIAESFGPVDFTSDYIENCTAHYEREYLREDGTQETMYVTQPFEIELVSLLV